MLKLLIRIFIKDDQNFRDEAVRRAYGSLCSVYGVALNLLLFAGKYTAGLFTGSMAVMADAFNNLSDAASSIISLLGFILSGKKPDPEHPFGHGRMEYLAGLALSMLIIFMGLELAKSSVEKIVRPQEIKVGLLPAFILIISILIKFYMSHYNRSIGKKIGSATMLAAAADSLSDCAATLVALAAMGMSFFFGLNIDPWAGLLVSVFICYTGYCAARDTISPLLGKAPDRELVQDIEERLMRHPEVIAVHDIMVHDYGPGRRIVSLHAEVDGHGDFFALHDAIDQAERELKDELGCDACIHMDPLETENSEVSVHRAEVTELLQQKISADISIHDFRMVPGPTHTKLIFDAAVPVDTALSDSRLRLMIAELVHSTWDDHYAVVTIDRIYTSK